LAGGLGRGPFSCAKPGIARIVTARKIAVSDANLLNIKPPEDFGRCIYSNE